MKNATCVNTSKVANVVYLTSLKSNVVKLDIDKLTELDVDKLRTVPVDLKRWNHVVSKKVVKKGVHDTIKLINSIKPVEKANYGNEINDIKGKIPNITG